MPLTINGGKIRKEGGNSPYGGFRSSIDMESVQATLITAESEQPAATEVTPEDTHQPTNPEASQTVTNQAEGQLFPDTPIQSQ